MKTDHGTISVKHWIRLQVPQLGRVVLLLFGGYIFADILVELLAPTTGSVKGSFELIVQEMRSFGYWIRKLILSFGGGLLYGALLWYWKARNYSTGTLSRKNENIDAAVSEN